MPGCRFCARLRNRVCEDCERAFYTALSTATEDWETNFTADGGFWPDETEQNQTLIDRAKTLRQTDPDAALKLYIEAADAGSPLASETVGWHYSTGTSVAVDRAVAGGYYYRAACAGSWRATIYYAGILEVEGYPDHVEQVLKDGMVADFVPSFFWLAWFRFRRGPKPGMYREVGPWMEYAAARGHPWAEFALARWMARGKLGIRNIPRGLRQYFAVYQRFL
ncbi:sel1 repeat family protein [Sphingomonas suaedae]|uniref:Sel1 repeat family protein n=1 Tax=Sphingomonas suaedae TaxID=2599297 RepID=A0A518RBL7_9SPHN|nr:sel1 repeat family protein [Sphingomonas suaedae]QDX24845.1 sel1 repeat family protein [Sphingomonas suaedae]